MTSTQDTRMGKMERRDRRTLFNKSVSCLSCKQGVKPIGLIPGHPKKCSDKHNNKMVMPQVP